MLQKDSDVKKYYTKIYKMIYTIFDMVMLPSKAIKAVEPEKPKTSHAEFNNANANNDNFSKY